MVHCQRYHASSSVARRLLPQKSAGSPLASHTQQYQSSGLARFLAPCVTVNPPIDHAGGCCAHNSISFNKHYIYNRKQLQPYYTRVITLTPPPLALWRKRSMQLSRTACVPQTTLVRRACRRRNKRRSSEHGLHHHRQRKNEVVVVGWGVARVSCRWQMRPCFESDIPSGEQPAINPFHLGRVFAPS